VSTDHNLWKERTAEADSHQGPSAYQPNALPLGQTGSRLLEHQRGDKKDLFPKKVSWLGRKRLSLSSCLNIEARDKRICSEEFHGLVVSGLYMSLWLTLSLLSMPGRHSESEKIKLTNLNSVRPFRPLRAYSTQYNTTLWSLCREFCFVRDRISIKMHSIESRSIKYTVFHRVCACNFQPGKFTGWGSEWVKHGRSHYGDLFGERIAAWLGSCRLFDPLCLNVGGVITVILSEKGFMALEVIVCSCRCVETWEEW